MDVQREEPQGKVVLFRGYTGNGCRQISQADLRRFLELKAAFNIARREYVGMKLGLLGALRSGAPVEPGFLSAESITRERGGYTVEPYAYEDLIVGC